MNEENRLNQSTTSEEFSHRQTLANSRNPDVFADANVALPRGPIATMAQLPIIPDDRWGLIHGTEKVSNGALKGETDGNSRLSFPCPQCETKLHMRLAGVSDDFTEWKPDEPNSDRCPMAIGVFAVSCPNCGLADHFKIPSDQHGRYLTCGPLPEAQSRRVSRTSTLPQALIPIITEADVDRNSGQVHHALRAETDTDYLHLVCPRTSQPINDPRLVAAIRERESNRRKEGLISISAFQFEVYCGPRCGFVGNFVIPVIGQRLRLLTQ
jgi:hypothetical protein